MPRSRVYLDFNATAPPTARAWQAARRAPWGNPNSACAEGRAAKRAVERARAQVASLINAEPGEVSFTSGGTQANAIALSMRAGEPLVVSTTEHNSVLLPAQKRGTNFVPVSDDGCIDPMVFGSVVANRRPGLISIMLANNEIGTTNDIAGLVRSSRDAAPRAAFHSDAVNALGKIPIDVRRLGVDMLSLSAHKIGGLKGVGALYVQDGIDADSPGTPNVPGIVAFGAAAQEAQAWLASRQMLRQIRLRDDLGRALASRGGVRIGDLNFRLPNTVAVVFPGKDAHAIVRALDAEGIATSIGSACGCQKQALSHVMVAVGSDLPAIRFSLGPHTTRTEIQRAIEAIWRVV